MLHSPISLKLSGSQTNGNAKKSNPKLVSNSNSLVVWRIFVFIIERTVFEYSILLFGYGTLSLCVSEVVRVERSRMERRGI
ncbi:hypothetical protein CEXT_650951 [Caerostris extrusa]|uniref:Uncharacterized protein n=1 Tax=Caerostris extrusa TaxID=172846 RepID=A0AAV4V122_CAEEX|nr:hypothetical protein CEXT_650951 [Caerostris extrusa]